MTDKGKTCLTVATTRHLGDKEFVREMNDQERFAAWLRTKSSDDMNYMSIESAWIAALAIGREEVIEEINDVCVVHWVALIPEGGISREAVRDAINRLCCQSVREALDPSISEDAQALIERGREEGRRERTVEITEKLAPWVPSLEAVMLVHYPECFGKGDE